MVHKIHAVAYFVTECSVTLKKFLTARSKFQLFSSKGFTLVELLMVVAIIGILATLAIPNFNAYILTTKNKRCATDIRVIDKAITAYILDKNALPSTATVFSDIGMPNQLDPWNRPYIFKNLSDVGAVPLEDIAGVALNTDYDLYSKGANNVSTQAAGNPNNADDIVRSNNGSFAGVRP
jgi:general secretion pathway protein G